MRRNSRKVSNLMREMNRTGVVGTVSECNWEFKSDGHKWAKIPYCVSVSFGDDVKALQRSRLLAGMLLPCWRENDGGGQAWAGKD